MLGNPRHQKIFSSGVEALQREMWSYRSKPLCLWDQPSWGVVLGEIPSADITELPKLEQRLIVRMT